MRKLMWAIIIIAIFALTMQAANSTAAYRVYKVKANQSVLGFMGPIGSKQFVSIRLKTAKRQEVKLLHRRSGPGLYTFYVKELIVKNEEGNIFTIQQEGYFVARRSQIIINKIQ